ncbi:hypothetical protein [Microbacterium sp. VKM Ac-2923]|uniref:hypothetical protein n=1 Tax=Microbacterium sp. VKM Ac-2923 TaxID=2929476 RepID=UPI001FB2BB63|nr:hypothetical protein [Microbacterium sp. VKM Ac-2923]MCJ1707808.1 hypothetical protein [Microbacterium sp. VKM Ac-2923]
MVERRFGRKTRVPRPGYAMVSVSARDANGFVHHYDDIEAPVGSLRESLAILHLHSSEMDAAHRGEAGA